MPKTARATANISAVVGSDEAEIKRVAAELAEKLTPPDAGAFGLEKRFHTRNMNSGAITNRIIGFRASR